MDQIYNDSLRDYSPIRKIGCSTISKLSTLRTFWGQIQKSSFSNHSNWVLHELYKYIFSFSTTFNCVTFSIIFPFLFLFYLDIASAFSPSIVQGLLIYITFLSLYLQWMLLMLSLLVNNFSLYPSKFYHTSIITLSILSNTIWLSINLI